MLKKRECAFPSCCYAAQAENSVKSGRKLHSSLLWMLFSGIVFCVVSHP
jgi:hypothetical protein